VNSRTRSRSSVRSSEEGGLKFLVCFVEAKRHDSGLVAAWYAKATVLRVSTERVNIDSEGMFVFCYFHSFYFFISWYGSMVRL